MCATVPVSRMFAVIRNTHRAFSRDDGTGIAAELAYRAFLSFVPFLLFVVTLGAFVRDAFGLPDPTDRLIELLGGSLPTNVTSVVHDQLSQLFGHRQPGLLSVALVLALVSATGGTNALVKAVNRAYGVTDRRPFWKKYLVALAVTLIVSAMLLAALVLSVVARVFGESLATMLGFPGAGEAAFGLATLPFVGLLIFGATVTLYRLAPSVQVGLSRSVPGAVAFVILLFAVTGLFSFYVGNVADYGATYGALASVVILLVWLYLAAALLVLGAELNAALAAGPQFVEDERDPDAATRPA